MEFLKRNLTQMQSQLREMSFATRWLIVSLCVIMVLVFGMLVWWGGSADMVPVGDVATGAPAEIVTALQTDGIDAKIEKGKVVVPASQKEEAVGSLSRSGHLNPNAHAAFDKLMSDDSGGWMLSSTDKDRRYMAAKGQFLSAVIQSFPNVESASVILDKPEANGFGVSHIDSSASVMVTMRSGSKVSRQMADTLIHMVGSAVAGLSEQHVTVSDTLNSRSFSAADPDDFDALQNVEATLASERLHKQKIEGVLRPWEGAMVAVKIVTSQTVHEQVQENVWDKPAISETESEERTSTNIHKGGEPGARAMLGANIDGSGGSGNETSESKLLERFSQPLALEQRVKRLAGNAIRKINVSVVVPRSYYVQIFKAQNPDSEEPSDDDLKEIVQAEQTKIMGIVTPQIVASEGEMEPGDINVAMAYDKAYLQPATAGVGGGLGAVLSSDLTKTGILAGLGVLAFGLMFYMVSRATRKEDLPTIEELAGVPPTLPTDDDLMGEVDQMDGGLAGVELDEEELRARQIADQISDLIRANPEEAGGLLTKWVVDDLN